MDTIYRFAKVGRVKSEEVVSIAASFRAGLLNLARERKEDFQFARKEKRLFY